MAKSRFVVSAGIIAGALALAPMSSAFAGGPNWSHGPSHAPAWHGGGGWHGGGWHGGGGYWRGGVWWPAAVAAAVVGTTAAIIAAPFVAFGNAVANSAYVPPAAPYYAPQQYYAPPVSYNAPQQYYAPPANYPQSYGGAPQYNPSAPSGYYQQAAPQYDNNVQPQGYYGPPATVTAPAYYAPPSATYYRQRAAPVAYNYYGR